MDAGNQPVRRAREEFHTSDVKIDQKPQIETRADLEGEVVVAEPSLEKDYADALAFAEEPITILIERSSEKFAPKVVDLWCNGKGAEVLMNGRWLETKCLPIGIPVTTKRKYVEILARSKVDSIETTVVKEPESEKNLIDRHTSSKAPFSVIEDKNPKGVEWLTRIIRAG